MPMTTDAHLTPAQREYFATLRRIDPSPEMEKIIQRASRSLNPNAPSTVQRQTRARRALRALRALAAWRSRG